MSIYKSKAVAKTNAGTERSKRGITIQQIITSRWGSDKKSVNHCIKQRVQFSGSEDHSRAVTLGNKLIHKLRK